MKASLKLHCFHFYGTERSSGSGQVSIPVMQVFCFCFFFKSVFLLFQTNLVEGLFLHFFCLLFYVACLLHKVSGFMFSFKSQNLNHSMAFL